MTVATLYEPDVYNGDGSLDTFPITFDFLNDNDYIKVTLKNEITLVYTLCAEHLQYEVSGANIIFNVGYIPTTNDLVIIEFDSDWLQNSDYVENSALPAENMEDDFDKLKLEVQALRDGVARSLRVGPDIDLDLVDPTDYFDIALTPELEALGDQSAELLALATDQADLTDIAANWTPASSSGAASLRFKEDSDNGTSGVYIKAPASLAGDVTLTLPTTDGDANQYLKTDGSGNMSWDEPSTITPGGETNSIQINDGAGGFTGYAALLGGNGSINVGKGSTTNGAINFFNSTNNYYNIIASSQASMLSSNTTFRLPYNNGAEGYVIYYAINGPMWLNQDTVFLQAWNHAGYDSSVAGGDYIMFQDVSTSGTLKKIAFQDISSFFGTALGVTGATSTVGSQLQFNEGTTNGTNYIILKCPDALAGNTTYTLPTTDGTSGQVLSTDGSGNLSWVDKN